MVAAPLSLSIWLAAATLLVLFPLALPLARLLATRTFPGKPVVEALVALPLVLPPTVLGFYLLGAFGAGGWLAVPFEVITGERLAFSFSGIVLASVLVNVPFAVQPMQRAFEAIPPDVREAAWVSGLSSWQTFWRIELPLAWPGIVSAFALVFAHALGEFGVILMVGGNIPGETQTASIAIYDLLQGLEMAAAGQLSLILLALSVVAIALVNLTQRPLARRYGETR